MRLISNSHRSISRLIQDIWLHRHLILLFTKRELNIKYSQTFLKKALLVIQPLGMMLVFSVFFGYILGLKSAGIPFPVFVFSGLIIWNLFSGGIQSAGSVLIDNSALIKNNNFPEIILSISKMALVSLDALINLVILMILMLFYKTTPSVYSFLMIVPFLLTLLFSFSTVLLVQAISIRKRDVLYVIPYFLNVLIWITPVFFTADILPQGMRFILYINPLTSIIELWRYCLIPGFAFDIRFSYALLVIIPYFILALHLYNRKQIQFNDLL